MKKAIKKAALSLALICVTLSTLMLCSCGVLYDYLSGDPNNSEKMVKEFCQYISADDFEAAAALVHPELTATTDEESSSPAVTAESIRAVCEQAEAGLGVNFAYGITIVQRDGVTTNHDFKWKNSLHSIDLKYTVTAAGDEFFITATVTNDDVGMYITEFTIADSFKAVGK